MDILWIVLLPDELQFKLHAGMSLDAVTYMILAWYGSTGPPRLRPNPSPQTVVADGWLNLSLVLPEFSPCYKWEFFRPTVAKYLLFGAI